jgi:hypothetical protein
VKLVEKLGEAWQHVKRPMAKILAVMGSVASDLLSGASTEASG